jgi:hypothetical protein
MLCTKIKLKKKRSIIVPFYGDDANTSVRCANSTEGYLGDISHLAPIPSSCPQCVCVCYVFL